MLDTQDTQYMCIYFKPYWGLEPFSPLESFWRLKSKWVYFWVTAGIQFYGARLKLICVVSCSWYIAWGMETLKWSLHWSLVCILKGAIIQLSPGGTKQTNSVDAKLNTWTAWSLPGPANIHTTDWMTVAYGPRASTWHECSSCELDT